MIYDTKVLSLSFPVPKNRYIGDIILAMEFGEQCPLTKKRVFQCIDIYRNPPIPGSINIMREHNDWIPMSSFTKDEVSGA